MDIKQRLTDLVEAGLKATQPQATAMVDPLFAHSVAKEALEWIERLEGFGIHMLMVHEGRTQVQAEALIKDVRGPTATTHVGSNESMDIKQGDRVTLKCGNQTAQGIIMLCSDNKGSLAVSLNEGISTPHGSFLNGVALLLIDGEYRELHGGAVFEVALTQ